MGQVRRCPQSQECNALVQPGRDIHFFTWWEHSFKYGQESYPGRLVSCHIFRHVLLPEPPVFADILPLKTTPGVGAPPMTLGALFESPGGLPSQNVAT